MEYLCYSNGNHRGNSDEVPDGTYTIIRKDNTVTILKNGDVLSVDKLPIGADYSIMTLGVRESCSGAAYAGNFLPQSKASAGFEKMKEELLKNWLSDEEK